MPCHGTSTHVQLPALPPLIGIVTTPSASVCTGAGGSGPPISTRVTDTGAPGRRPRRNARSVTLSLSPSSR